MTRPRRADPWAGVIQPGPIRRLDFGADEWTSRMYDAVALASGTTDARRKRLVEIVEKFDNRHGDLARQVVLTSHPDYVTAFFRLLHGDNLLTQGETLAVREVKDLMRAMSLTDGAGGYLVPAQLDPTLIIAGDGSQDDIASISRNVVATGDQWTGVSAAQISASWDAEAAEVSDDSPTLVQPTVPVHMSRVFVPFSIEVGMDAANFSENVVRLMADAQRNLERAAFATGSGSDQPTGIVTALTGGSSEVASATTDTFALADVFGLYDAVPARYKDGAAWVANELVYSLIRQFDNSNNNAYWTDLNGPTPARLIGRPTYASSSMDGVINAGADNRVLIVGDFTNYVIARRLGFTLELVPHLFHTSNNRPSGQRGFFGYARLGADSVNDGAFRMLNVT